MQTAFRLASGDISTWRADIGPDGGPRTSTPQTVDQIGPKRKLGLTTTPEIHEIAIRWILLFAFHSVREAVLRFL